jgi:cysteine desulfurase
MPDLPSLAAPSPSAGARQRAGTPIYLDYHASTPCDPRVVEAMLPFFVEMYANPSSSHCQGKIAADAVQRAREQVASALGAAAGEIVFTSGATESNNLAILGVARTAPPHRRRLLASAIEHKAVLEPMRALQRAGFEFELVPVESDGRVDLAALAALVDNRTALVSIQAANNEIGTLQPVAEIAQVVHGAGAVFHCDAAQALGRIPMDVVGWDVDLLSISGHKCYGPKGVGALFVRGGARAAPLEPLFFGGGQEHELRPGTLNVPGIVGLGHACELIVEELGEESRRVAQLRDRFEAFVLAQLPGTQVNGCIRRRLPGNSSIRVSVIEAEAVIANLPDVVLSTGSACTSGALAPSHVLTAIGLTREQAGQTLRVGIGRFTRSSDLEISGTRIVETIRRLGTWNSEGVEHEVWR